MVCQQSVIPNGTVRCCCFLYSFGCKGVLSLSVQEQPSNREQELHMWATESSNCRVRLQHTFMAPTLKTQVSGKVLVVSLFHPLVPGLRAIRAGLD